MKDLCKPADVTGKEKEKDLFLILSGYLPFLGLKKANVHFTKHRYKYFHELTHLSKQAWKIVAILILLL